MEYVELSNGVNMPRLGYGVYQVTKQECERCVFLPKCYGGCEANYIEGDSPCMIEKYLIKAYLQIL